MGTFIEVTGSRRAQQVMDDTWGHLRPSPHRRYTGSILYAFAAYGGEIVIIDSDFGDLPDSPWLYEHMLDLVLSLPLDDGKVYRWSGTYQVTKARGVEFVGAAEDVTPKVRA